MAGKTFRAPVGTGFSGQYVVPKVTHVAPKLDFESGSAGSEVLKVFGLDALYQNLLAMPPAAMAAAGAVTAELAAEIIQLAQDEYVPFLDGDLRDSGGSDEFKAPIAGMAAPTVIQIAMWFGAPGSGIGMGAQGRTEVNSRRYRAGQGASEGMRVVDPSEYAMEQHENLVFRHHPPPDQTGPKYLERPFLQLAPELPMRISMAVAEALGVDGPVEGMPAFETEGYGFGV